MSDNDPEIGKSIAAGGIRTNCLEAGEGSAVMLLHGSGPGVTAYANWRLVIPHLADRFRVIAPDLVGFGYTERPDSFDYNLDSWVQHVVDLIQSLKLERVSVVGNSFGGGLAVALVTRYPNLVDRIVLMGSMGLDFPLTPGLDAVWGYQPSPDTMNELLRMFVDDKSMITKELVESRFRASIRPGYQESFERLFPAPRQAGIRSLVTPESDIRRINIPTLVVHGKSDQIIPLETSLKLNSLIATSQLHVFSRCGHWVQIEQNSAFCRLVRAFLEGGMD